jgi:hypothetical protein
MTREKRAPHQNRKIVLVMIAIAFLPPNKKITPVEHLDPQGLSIISAIVNELPRGKPAGKS